MNWCLRVIFFVGCISMKIGLTHAICAARQSSTIFIAACVEPVLIGQGYYASSKCRLYASSWASYCVQDGSCDICICSCGANTGCPPGNFSSELNSSECSTCPAGYFSLAPASPSIENCILCAADTFSLYGSEECTACPDNSQSPTGSVDPSNCMCNMGYTGVDRGICVACEAGKFKTNKGDAPCSLCEAGKYSSTISLFTDTCDVCPTLSNSLAASDELIDCKCNAGSTGSDGTPCTSCVAGKYKIATGDAVCTSCLAGKYRHPNFEYNWARSCGAARTDACPTAQSSDAYGGDKARAVDGNSNAVWGGSSCTHTFCSLDNWWSVTLDETPILVTGLRVRGRQDCCHTRTANYAIHVGNDLTAAGRLQNNAVCVPAVAGRALTRYSADNLVCQQPIYGRTVIFSVVLPAPPCMFLTLCEVEIWSPECAHCPENSVSLPGSSHLTACACNAGWSGTSSDCKGCVEGK